MLRSSCALVASFALAGPMLALTLSVASAEEPTPDAPGANASGVAEARILEVLEERVSLSLEETPLRELVGRLRERHEINVLLDSKAMDDVGLADDAPLSGKFQDISLRSILNVALADLDLAWEVEGGALVITTTDELETRLRTKVYKVSDLVQGGDGQAPYDHAALVAVLMSVIAPESWNEVGGAASVAPYRETILVRQTAANHRDIDALLNALRQARKLTLESMDTAPAEASIRLSGKADLAIRDTLKKPVSLDWQAVPLRDAAQQLREQLGVSIRIDVRALDEVGLSSDLPLHLSVRDMPAGQALRHALAQVDLTWSIHDEVLSITTPEEAETQLETRIYPVRDLFDAQHAGDEFGDGPSGGNASEFVHAMTTTIVPEMWAELGGPGSAAALPSAGALAISQTTPIHERIEDLLVRLRKQLADKPPLPADQPAANVRTLRLVVYSLPISQTLTPALGRRTENHAENAPRENLGQFGGVGPVIRPIPGKDLVEIVVNLVEPGSWNGEGVYIKAVPGRLIVRHTDATHRRIDSLLTKLGLLGADHGGYSGFGPRGGGGGSF